MRRAVPILLRPNVLVETGRASYGGVIHQLPRLGGVRECLVARPGKVLCSCDYTGVELATHGQNCLNLLGRSNLAAALNAGVKVHDALGATIANVQYDAFVAANKAGDSRSKKLRGAAKPANFGFPGGMGALKLVLAQRKGGPDTPHPSGPSKIWDGKQYVQGYKGLRFCLLMDNADRCGGEGNMVREWKGKPCPPTCRSCIVCAETLRAKWFQTWPENVDYFKLIADFQDNGMEDLPPGSIYQHVSRRVRGGTDFCSAANGFFQGLAADGAKRALCRVSRECYDSTFRLPDGERSPLFGCRVILFAHDEIIVEMPEATAHEAAQRLSVIMVESMRVFTPDVAVEAPPALMYRWDKAADPVYVDGRLVPWEKKAA